MNKAPPFPCDYCDKKYKFKRNMKRHMKKHLCNICQIYTLETLQKRSKPIKNTTVNTIAVVNNPTLGQPPIIFEICYHQVVGKLKMKNTPSLSILANKLWNVIETPHYLKLQLRNPPTTAKITKSGFITYTIQGENFENINRIPKKIIKKIRKVSPFIKNESNKMTTTNITATTYLPLKMNFYLTQNHCKNIDALEGNNIRIKIKNSVFTIFPNRKILMHVHNESNFHPHLQQLVDKLYEIKAIESK